VKKIFAAMAVLVFVFVFVCAGMARAEDLPGHFPAFSSQTLDGKSATDAVFYGKKLTMINIWATWCPPCVSEMPGLGKLGRSMPEGSQLVGIVLDAEDPEDSDTIDKARNILSKAKSDFLQILPVEAMGPVMDLVEAIPTTIFVDSEGKIVGDPIVGAHSEKDYRTEVEKILKSMQ
jgi:thiol-disulfide isomerase/thioredoxin